jgi:hypothetical protein
MSEKKKPWAVKAVFARTLDELASSLEDALNKSEEEGYSIRLDKMDPKEGLGYLIIGRKAEPRVPQIHIVPIESPNDPSEMKPLTDKFLEALFEGDPMKSWGTIGKNASKIIPELAKKYTSTDLIAIADDLDEKLKLHADGHGDSKECDFHRVLSVVSKMTRELASLHLS